MAAGEWLEGIRIRIPLDVFCILETHKSDGDGFDDKSARRHLVFFSPGKENTILISLLYKGRGRKLQQTPGKTDIAMGKCLMGNGTKI